MLQGKGKRTSENQLQVWSRVKIVSLDEKRSWRGEGIKGVGAKA
jgi:hypothetical protein